MTPEELMTAELTAIREGLLQACEWGLYQIHRDTVFDAVTKQLIEEGNVEIKKERTDSYFIKGVRKVTPEQV